MRILLITHFFPPAFNAGTENYTLGLAKELLKKGHEVCVLCAADWQTGETYWNGVTEDIHEGVRVNRIHLNWLKASNPNRILYDSQPAEKWLNGFLSQEKPDLVHVTSTISLGVGILRSVKRSGLPLIISLMDFWFVCPSVQLLKSDGSLCNGQTTAYECQACLLADSNLYQNIARTGLPETYQANLLNYLSQVNFIAKRRGFRGMLLDISERKKLMPDALSLADRILTHSNIVQEIVQKIISVPIDVLRNGQHLPWQQGYPLSSPSEKIRFGYIGQIEAIKGVHILVEAFQQAAINEQASLGIWGDLTRNEVYVQKLLAI